LGETVLRVKDLPAVRRFYTDVVGLDILQEFDGITFLKVADGGSAWKSPRSSIAGAGGDPCT
jgi:catechol-2,3-dioxygenase